MLLKRQMAPLFVMARKVSDGFCFPVGFCLCPLSSYSFIIMEVRSWLGVSARHRGGVFLAILSFLHLFIRMQLMDQYLRVELCCSSLPDPLCLVTIRLVFV